MAWLRATAVRRGLAALAMWLAIAGVAPPVVAEYGIAPGASALITAGQPILVRVTPGWDAAVSYEIADGASVTVWDVAQTAPDGSLWYAIDGGFVPAESVTSVAPLDPASQEAQDVATAAWVEPIEEASQSAPAPSMVAEAVGDSVDGAWIDPAAPTGYVDPTTGAWVEPAALVQEAAPDTLTELGAQAGFVDPNTGIWVEPSANAPDIVTDTWVEPVPVDAPVEAPAQPAPDDAWIDPAVDEEWAALEPDETVAVEDAVWESDDTYVELEQRGKKRDKKNKGKNTKKGKDKRGGDGSDHGASTSTGQQIADFALQYQGYPYVYAGEGPHAFDCSGFTMFVIRETLGIHITHDMFTQYDMGQEVGRNELQPGDVVFFRNTFRRGMSHNGIYIGGGQFVHAENESTGVVVSDLESDYYGSRWYGAVRFGA